MNLLILKGFNNYFNRKIKKYTDLQDYIDNSTNYYDFSDINFNPNDGVATSQVVGSENQKEIDGAEPEPLKWETEGSPDYLIAYTQETIDETVVTTIHSRWFVLESVRTRNGQYQLALKRDIIADKLEEILTNPCFVEKGYVSPNNKLIFNEENVSLNQVKKSETILTDETGIPWLVLYVAKNAPATATSVKTTVISDLSGSAMLYNDLPWSNIETPDAQSIDTSFTRRIAGAAEINISPIVSIKHQRVGTPNVYAYPARANCRYLFSNNDWVFDISSSETTYIGHMAGGYLMDILQRGDLKLTPASNLIHWNDDGVIVPTWISKNTVDTYERSVQVLTQSTQVICNGFLIPMAASRINSAKSYLNTKKTALEANVSHATVPGQPNLEAYVGGNQSFMSAEDILSYNGKLVQRGANVYKIKIVQQNKYSRPIDYFTLDGNNDIQPSSANTLASSIFYGSTNPPKGIGFEENANNRMVETFFEHSWFDITYERVTSEKIRCGVQVPSSRVQVNDAAYDMICIPYGPIKVGVPKSANPGDVDSVITVQKEASIAIARGIAEQLGSSVYDVQLLPYCPVREIAEQYKDLLYDSIDLIAAAWAYGFWAGVYPYEQESDPDLRKNMRSIIFWSNYTHATFNIEKPIRIPEADSIEYKVFNACKKYRLVSPNYSSVFEFNPLKNNGVSVFNVDFTYKPFNPYIHIAPFFNESGLYGVDTNDQRGLVLQGDFSVGYYSDKWAQYQIQNANYANIFDRQIQNIDVAQGIEREKQTWNNWATGITEGLGLGGGLQGAKAFSGLGPWGMLGGGIGGTVGGITGAAVGLPRDWEWLTRAQKEEKSYAIDMYNLQLGNVKALPYGLAKSDALTENFKYFPFVEEYDCTDVEKEMFKNKLKYDGMTVMGIATIAEYLPEGNNYEFQKIKGRMIMLDNITDDFQIANDIYEEVNKGFYYIPVESEGE